MLGYIDSCKWIWKYCPKAHHGRNIGKEKVPTLTMEEISDDILYFWDVFICIAGCKNDIAVLNASPLVSKIADGTYPIPCEYSIEEIRSNKLYWLCDGIYPKYPCFLHSILNPNDKEESYYASRQEGRRKDIERAFGVLQAKFHIVALPCKLWSNIEMKNIMYCCVIHHNMVVNEIRPLVHLDENDT